MNLRSNIRKILLEFKNNNFLNEDDGVTTTQTTEDPTSLGQQMPEVVLAPLLGCKDDVAIDGSKLRLPNNLKEEKIKRVTDIKDCKIDKNKFPSGRYACIEWNKVGWGQKNHNPFKNYDDCLTKYANTYMNLCKVGGVKSFEYGDRIWKTCITYTKNVLKNGKQTKVVRFPEELVISSYYGFTESDWDEVENCNSHPGGVTWNCTEIKNKKKEENYKLDTPDNVVKDTEKGGDIGSPSLTEPQITTSNPNQDGVIQFSLSLTGSGGNK
jgi:hypothetical protein